MAQKSGLNRSILEQNLGQVRQQLTCQQPRTGHKTEWAGRKLVLVDPRNTTRTCSRCGNHQPQTGGRQSLSLQLVLSHDRPGRERIGQHPARHLRCCRRGARPASKTLRARHSGPDDQEDKTGAESGSQTPRAACPEKPSRCP